MEWMVITCGNLAYSQGSMKAVVCTSYSERFSLISWRENAKRKLWRFEGSDGPKPFTTRCRRDVTPNPYRPAVDKTECLLNKWLKRVVTILWTMLSQQSQSVLLIVFCIFLLICPVNDNISVTRYCLSNAIGSLLMQLCGSISMTLWPV